MAQKRMFDRAITSNERFIDLPVSSKALYFILGMEADDEGFVSARSIMRVHGFSEDDLSVLIAKGYCIRCPSGIIVITHWRKNNWLDARRIRRTEYLEDRKMLTLTTTNDYVLSNGLARIEENRIEEKANAKEPENPKSTQLTKEERERRMAEIRQSLSKSKKI